MQRRQNRQLEPPPSPPPRIYKFKVTASTYTHHRKRTSEYYDYKATKVPLGQHISNVNSLFLPYCSLQNIKYFKPTNLL